MRIKNLTLNSDDQVITKITGEILRAFHIETGDVDADFDEFKIFNEVTGDKVLTRLIVKDSKGERHFKASSVINLDERRGAEIHRLIKKNLYKILTGDLKLRGVPYGIMHGVRPTKIIHRWLRNGYGVTSHGIIDRDKISRRLRADYLTNYEKSLLLTEVALRQIPILTSSSEKTIGVYVGIPFCVTRCLYCSFPSNILPDDDKVAEFMEVLTRDIDAAAAEIKRYGLKVQSIYIGGGTPTSLPQKFFTELMEKVTAAFYGDRVEEFTVECGRADTIDDEKIAVMKNSHVTRVCVNPQTMQDKTLERIGREHTAAQVVTAFEKLRKASDWQINMDLILGLPGESFDDVIDSLKKVLALEPDDVTLHALALKRGSQLQTQLADEVSTLEDFELPSDEEVRRMADAAEKILRGENYQPYYLYRQGYISGQIENIGYCKRGAECIYNVQIMDERQTILGVGAAASTKVPDNEAMRLQSAFHAKDLTTYLRDIDKYIDNREKVLAEVHTPVEVPAVDEIVEDKFSAEPVDTPVEVPAVDEVVKDKIPAEPVDTPVEVPAVDEVVKDKIPAESADTPVEVPAVDEIVKDKIPVESVDTPVEVPAINEVVKDKIPAELADTPLEVPAVEKSVVREEEQ